MAVAARSPVSATVHDALRADVLSGRLGPGDALRSERALAEAFGVNRQAVREAVKRLEQAGLVAVSHGGATRVRDWRGTGGLELLIDLPGGLVGEVGEDLVRDVLEMRASIGADAARRCAARSGPGMGPALEAAIAAGEAADGTEGLAAAYAELWAAIVAGARNLAYRLALNSLVAGLGGVAEQEAVVGGEWRAAAAQRALAEAIVAGDGDGAFGRARALLEGSL